jgi:hypothetical protein
MVRNVKHLTFYLIDTAKLIKIQQFTTPADTKKSWGVSSPISEDE